jgi:hypothetical protein
MVKVSPRRLAPPRAEDASVMDPASDAVMSVAVAKVDGCFVFEFALRGADWVGQDARAVKPWAAVTAEWLGQAWEVAAEALRRHLSGTAQPADVRCGGCGWVVTVPDDAPGPVVEVLCGTDHALVFDAGVVSFVGPDGRRAYGTIAP